MNNSLVLSKSERAYKKKSKSKPVYAEWISESLLIRMDNGQFISVESELFCHPQLVSHVLSYAVKNKKYNHIEFLLDRDANPNMLVDKGNSFLHLVREGACTQLLIQRGANINHKNDEGLTPFFSAIAESRCDIASILCKAGASVDEVDKNDDTSLHYAIANLGPNVIKFLLYCQADTKKPNKQGVNPREMALNCGGDVLKAFQQWDKIFTAITTSVGGNFTVMNLLAQDGCLLKKILKFNSSNRCSPNIVIVEQLLQQCDDEVFSELGSDNSSYDADLVKLALLIKQRPQNQKDFLEALRNNEFKKAKDYVQANPYILYVYEGQTDEMSILFIQKFLAVSCLHSDYCYIKELLNEGFDFSVRDAHGHSVFFLGGIESKKYDDLSKYLRI